jgi:hypothetical protein
MEIMDAWDLADLENQRCVMIIVIIMAPPMGGMRRRLKIQAFT